MYASGAGTVDVVFDSPTDMSYSKYFEVQSVDASVNVLSAEESGEDITLAAGVERGCSYYVKVLKDSFYDGGTYSLTTTATQGSTLFIETESNDSIADADIVFSGESISGQLSSSSDVDVYEVYASGAGTIDVVFDSPTDLSYSKYF